MRVLARITDPVPAEGAAIGRRVVKAAYRERFSLLVLFELDPRFDNLRTEPRFTNLLSRIVDHDARQHDGKAGRET